MKSSSHLNRTLLLVALCLLGLSALQAACQRIPPADGFTPTFPYPLVSTVSHASSPTAEPSTATMVLPTQTVAVKLPPVWTPTVFASTTVTPTPTPPSFPIVLSSRGRDSPPTEMDQIPSRRIAYVSAQDGVKHVFTIQEDGSNLTQLTDGEFFDTFPAWSHEGEMIVFLRAEDENSQSLQRSNILLMDLEGGSQVNLTPAMDMQLASITWAPDDSAIAFDAADLGGDPVFSGSNIFVVNIRSLASTQISNTSALNVGCSLPSWSPDGAHLIFTCRALMNAGLVMGSRDGSDTYVIDFLGQVDQAIWLPSGGSIAYTGGMSCLLSTLDPDYMLQQGEIDFGRPPCFDEEIDALGYERMPVYAVHWSPSIDTRFILQSFNLLQIIDLEQGEIIQVAGDFGGVEGQVSWGPKEARVVFTYYDDSDFEIAVVDLRTHEISPLTNNEMDDMMPAWQPLNRD